MLQRQVRGCTDTCRQFLRRRQGQSNKNLPYYCDYQYFINCVKAQLIQR